ncbi:MAG: hypothetical protein KAW56_01750 [Candidatus Marinimicrobia bacterium]|nr:hypothetical protein [Candidatus Neomarinimicrobiota bacterium]
MKNKKRFTWSDAIIEVLTNHSNVASLKTLHIEAPKIYAQFNKISGLTPYKTINERVQRDNRITKLSPGLYVLTEFLNELPKKYNPEYQTKDEKYEFTHVSIQSILLQLGKIYRFHTYTPDKSKSYLDKKLGDFATLERYPEFTYKRVIDRVKMVDVTWFNERMYPSCLFEVEKTSDIKNALSKFMELMDFKTKMKIISTKERENEFYNIMEQPTFKPILKQVKFWTYEKVEKLYQSEKEISPLRAEVL